MGKLIFIYDKLLNSNYICNFITRLRINNYLSFNKTIVPASWITAPTDSIKMLGDTVVIHCHASGHPRPVISWSKRNPDNAVGRFIDIEQTMQGYRYEKKCVVYYRSLTERKCIYFN